MTLCGVNPPLMTAASKYFRHPSLHLLFSSAFSNFFNTVNSCNAAFNFACESWMRIFNSCSESSLVCIKECQSACSSLFTFASFTINWCAMYGDVVALASWFSIVDIASFIRVENEHSFLRVMYNFTLCSFPVLAGALGGFSAFAVHWLDMLRTWAVSSLQMLSSS